MQEGSKEAQAQKLRNSRKLSPDDLDVEAAKTQPTGSETPFVKTLAPHDFAKSQYPRATDATAEPAKLKSVDEKRDVKVEAKSQSDAKDIPETPVAIDQPAPASVDAADEQDVRDSAVSPYAARSEPTTGLMTTPLLALVAGVAVLAAGWSFATLEETRGQLATITSAKGSVDRALADAQSRLSAAEKAVADVKAVLTPKAPAGAAPSAPAAAAPGK